MRRSPIVAMRAVVIEGRSAIMRLGFVEALRRCLIKSARLSLRLSRRRASLLLLERRLLRINF